MPFPITCTACQKTFSIADDVYERKVKGRVVTIKCKQCQAGIRVDGTSGGAVAALSDSVRPPPVAEATARAIVDPVSPSAADAAPPPPAPVVAAPAATPSAAVAVTPS